MRESQKWVCGSAMITRPYASMQIPSYLLPTMPFTDSINFAES